METFEYPRSSAGLSLLMNLRQTEREAEAHGVAEPELRFEKNSGWLAFFVPGTDHRFEYGDSHTPPTRLLEGLEREGCVEIAHDAEGSGTLTITEKGRKKSRPAWTSRRTFHGSSKSGRYPSSESPTRGSRSCGGRRGRVIK